MGIDVSQLLLEAQENGVVAFMDNNPQENNNIP
jgi:hypothetical protein